MLTLNLLRSETSMTEKPQNITSISGKRLREARKSVKLTQEQLSELANISVQHLSYIECGKRRLTADTANILSPYLNVCPPYLMGEIDFKTINEQLKANKNYCETSCDFIVKFFNFIDLNIDFLCSIDSNSEYQPEKFYGPLYTDKWFCRLSNGLECEAQLEEVKIYGDGVTYFRTDLVDEDISVIYLTPVEFAIFLGDTENYIYFLINQLRSKLTGREAEVWEEELKEKKTEEKNSDKKYYIDNSKNTISFENSLFIEQTPSDIQKTKCKFGSW